MQISNHDFNLVTGSIFDKIKKAGNGNLLVRITYVDKEGTQSIRTVEPYEFKKGKLYAHCSDKSGIRAFDLTRISHAELTTTPFTPQFAIKLEG